MVADGVVGQLIYGTLASQTSADGRSYFANLEARNYERLDKNAAGVPPFCAK